MIIPCKACGKEFKTKYRVYCSKECKSRSMSGSAHPRFSSIKGNCYCCGKELLLEKRRQNRLKVHCSIACRSETWRSEGSPKLERRYKVPCGYCGKIRKVLKRQLGEGHVLYCSRKCANKAHSLRMEGAGNSNYLHGGSGVYPN